MTDVPLVDVVAQHRDVEREVWAGLSRLFETGAYVRGPDVAAFEASYANFAGRSHCVGVANGTDAIELALRALDLRQGDEVIVPASTFIATVEAVLHVGGRPVIVDVDPATLLMDPRAVAAAASRRTRAIVPVHLHGQMAPVEQLAPIAEACGAAIVEDAAQAHGATRYGATPGSLTAAATTSFYPGKNLGAYGDAGALLTDSSDLADKVRRLADHNVAGPDIRPRPGRNSRLDAIQALVLTAKLPHLDGWNRARRTCAARYHALLVDFDLTLPSTLTGNEHVWHVYAVRVAAGVRDRVLEALRARGIGAGIHYRLPVHLDPAVAHLGYRQGDMPNAERAAAEMLSLPIHPHLSESDQVRVVEVLGAAL
ncbi:MAG TPA: DegT/DnrJ/EryC1/StrS family aminotransferase [Acidimicrobiales bacterium]|jgi:dTDP-4-amino-4,6-dideoxygalactose transaminase|nr:DegT/DnrJ/EryC1/StrS family aminotransferase [Acidimicrobiales bacterium]